MSFRKNREEKRKAASMKMVDSSKSSINRTARTPDPVTVRVADKATQENPDVVPSGTAPEIVSWVGSDAEKAQKALDLELQDERPRKGHLSSLQAVVDAEATEAEADSVDE